MPDKHYDVVVLGRSLGALVCAALLSRRDNRVLLLGQGARPPSYRLGRHVLRRRAPTVLVGACPVFRRVLTELAQTQTLRRRAFNVEPALQCLLPDARFDISADPKMFEREIGREFTSYRRLITEQFARLERSAEEADAVFEEDLVWPPGTFWERRATHRAASKVPLLRTEPDGDLFGGLPVDHPFRRVHGALVGHAGSMQKSSLSLFAQARLYAAFTRGLVGLPRGADDLEDFLLERIALQGGTYLPAERAHRVLVERGQAIGVCLEGESTPIGASFVVTDAWGEQVASLAQGQGIQWRAERDWPCLTPCAVRFVMSVVVRRDGIPDHLGREAFVFPRDDRYPPLHVSRLSAGDEPGAPPEANGEDLLVVEVLIPVSPWTDASRLPAVPEVRFLLPNMLDAGGRPLDTAPGKDGAGVTGLREWLLSVLCEAMPFLDRHVAAVDSPHDGRPGWLLLPNGRPQRDPGRGTWHYQEVERLRLGGCGTQPEPMVPVWSVEQPGLFGLAGEPVRGPVGRTLLVGTSVLPALGQEGELLAAWSAARLVTRADSQKERIRRAMWRKVEIG